MCDTTKVYISIILSNFHPYDLFYSQMSERFRGKTIYADSYLLFVFLSVSVLHLQKICRLSILFIDICFQTMFLFNFGFTISETESLTCQHKVKIMFSHINIKSNIQTFHNFKLTIKKENKL